MCVTKSLKVTKMSSLFEKKKSEAFAQLSDMHEKEKESKKRTISKCSNDANDSVGDSFNQLEEIWNNLIDEKKQRAQTKHNTYVEELDLICALKQSVELQNSLLEAESCDLKAEIANREHQNDLLYQSWLTQVELVDQIEKKHRLVSQAFVHSLWLLSSLSSSSQHGST